MAVIQHGYLRIQHSNHFDSYQTSAKSLHHFLYPLHQNQSAFQRWINNRIEFYGFEAGYDFVPSDKTNDKANNEDDDLVISLNMAKELARIERTERGQEARYYFVEFEYQLQSSHPKPALFDKKVKQLNALAESMKVGKSVVMLPTLTVINLISAIRQYQALSHCYVPCNRKVSPIWVNDLIDNIKHETGKLLLDDEGML